MRKIISSQSYIKIQKITASLAEKPFLYTQLLTLESVASYIGVTASHLSRVLNGGCKSSFPNILNSLRIYEAKRLLEQTDITISDAAYEVGYGSIRNFNRIFKQYFNCNPKDVRKS